MPQVHRAATRRRRKHLRRRARGLRMAGVPVPRSSSFPSTDAYARWLEAMTIWLRG